jgi:hypothetical protein
MMLIIEPLIWPRKTTSRDGRVYVKTLQVVAKRVGFLGICYPIRYFEWLLS